MTSRSTGTQPPLVERNLRLLRDHDIWHLTSRNPPVRSCKEAAAQRRRLGTVGIPLCDELKSLLFASGHGGERRYTAVHCRGHQRLDLDKVRSLVGAPVEVVRPEELAARFGAEYGTVTPFLVIHHPDVRQVVDHTVLERYYAPHTVMTNLGDLEHAVEFHAEQVFDPRFLPRTTHGDVVDDQDKRVPRHTLGILTGNSPESGMLLWQRINETIRVDPRVRTRGDTGFPRVVIESVPDMGASMELQQREDDVRPVVLGAVRRLCEAGVTILGLACNTTQYFEHEIDELCAGYDARFVSLAEATRRHLDDVGITTFDLLGIGSVADLDGWSAFGRALSGFDVRVPERKQVEAISRLAFQVKREVISAEAVNALRDLLRRSTSTDTVVVALTELSVVLERQNSRSRYGKTIVDTLDLLAKDMAEPYLVERLEAGAR